MILKKSEIKNILDREWKERREKVKEASKKNSERTKEWKAKEKLNQLSNKESPPAPRPPQKRQKHYLEEKIQVWKNKILENNKK